MRILRALLPTSVRWTWGAAIMNNGLAGDARRRTIVWELFEAQPVAEDGGLHDDLRRLCCAAAARFGMSGAAVSILGYGGADAVAASTDSDARSYVEMQFTTGEGPCLDANRTSEPVIVPDLFAVDLERWLGYLSIALASGLRSVTSVPVREGAVRLGVLDVFCLEPTHLTDEQVSELLVFGQAAAELILDRHHATPEATDQWLEAVDYRPEVYQAQGWLATELRVSLPEALTRLRAYSYAHRRAVVDVAADLLAGEIASADLD